MRGEVLLPGRAEGPVLRLVRPISFWGGVDPMTGCIVDPGSEARGRPVAGTVLVLPATRGSSSSSAVLLELLARRLGPAALVLGEPDAILVVGVLVAREMGWPTIPVLRLDAARQQALADGETVTVAADGTLARPGAPA